MPRGDQLGRQWIIIQTIAVSHNGKTVAELADELGCNPRTVYRDLEALQVAGVPIYNEKIDGKNLWLIIETYKHQIPIPFSLPELLALYFSRDLVKALQSTMFHDSLESLFRKIKTTLPPESEKFLKNIQQVLHVSQGQHKEYGKYKEIISRVNDAAVKSRTIKIVYYTMSRKEETRRKVDPYKIWYFDGSFYLVGLCHMRRDIRTFALERIKLLTVTKEEFNVPDDFSIEELMRGAFGVIRGKPEKVRVFFDSCVAGYIEEKIWHESQIIHKQDDGSVMFEADVAVTDELKSWILGWGANAEVFGPQSLIDELKEETLRMFEKYNPAGKLKKRSAL